MKKVFFDSKTGLAIYSDFDKHIEGKTYDIFFNTKTGVEVLKEKDGFEEPFYLEFPSLLDIGIMGNCQNKCSFCYQGDYQQPNMKLEHFKLIIDQIKDKTMQIALGGRGDPNKHENFKEIIEYSVINNVVPSYTTSGNNLKDEEVEISKKCGAVAVSNYNKDFTYLALQKFMDAKIKTNIHYVVTSETIDNAINLIKGIDIWDGKIDLERLNAIIFLLFKPQGRGSKREDLIPLEEKIEQFAKIFITPKSLKYKIGADSCMVNHLHRHVKVEGILKNCLDCCEGARMSSYISPDMLFYPCSYCFKDDYKMSLLENTIENYWNRQPFIDFRNKIKNNPFYCPVGF